MNKMVDKWNAMSDEEMKKVIDRVISNSFVLGGIKGTNNKSQLEMHFTIYKMMKKQIIEKYCI